MGLALIVTTVSEESLWVGALFDVDSDGNEINLADKYSHEWRRVLFRKDELFEQHPNAYWKLPVARADVWDLPTEPWRERGIRWHQQPELRRVHAQAVRESLEAFLNAKLAALYHMVRTGWWVLGKARVRVVECKKVPEREMGASSRRRRGRKAQGPTSDRGAAER